MRAGSDGHEPTGETRPPRATAPEIPAAWLPLPPPSPPPERRGRRLWWFVVGAIGLVAVVVAVVLLWPEQSAPPVGAADEPAPPEVVAEVPAPPPPVTNLRATRPALGQVELRWRSDPSGTQPEAFRVLRTGTELATVPAASGPLRFTDKDATPGETYVYSVLAMIGDLESASVDVRVRVPMPPLGAARLEGSFEVVGRLTAESGYTNRGVGDRFRETWTFDARCKTGACATRVSGPAPLPQGTWTMKLERHGTRYRGTAKASMSSCLGLPVSDTLVVTLEVTRAKMVGGEWRVTSWSGTFEDSSPYTSMGLQYCPSSSYTAAVRGT